MYIVAWVIKIIAIQLMLMGVNIAYSKGCDPYIYIIMIGSIMFSIGGNILYVNERAKNRKKDK